MQGVKMKSLSSYKEYAEAENYNGDYVFFSDFKVSTALGEPYRSDYYCIGLHLEGELTLFANLVEYRLTKPCIILADKTAIKQWNPDVKHNKSQSILISDQFIQKAITDQQTFSYLSTIVGTGVFITELNESQLAKMKALFDVINMHTPASTKMIKEVIRGAVYSLISYIGSLYNHFNPRREDPQDYCSKFLVLVSKFAKQHRNIAFYAEHLGVNPKYLGHIVKMGTGLAAGDWIKKQVILEAKIYLQQRNAIIADIADSLCFTDQSTFGKYFKKHGGGMSPATYRKYLSQLV